jgi:hypothetical protein
MKLTGGAVPKVLAVLLAAVMVCVAGVATGADPDAYELVRLVETQYRGETSYSVMTMSIITDAWSRELTMEAWSEGRNKFLAVITAPRKEEGTATLKIDDEIWNYLPRIDRLLKIPSGLMGDSWMGSHLTNDDLVKEDKVEEVYDLTVAERDGDRIVIDGVPKSDAAVVWGRIEYHIDLARRIPLLIRYFDEDDALVRTMTFDDVRQTGDRWVPMAMLIQPEEKPDEHTRIQYDELAFGVALGDDLFSLRSLRRR